MRVQWEGKKPLGTTLPRQLNREQKKKKEKKKKKNGNIREVINQGVYLYRMREPLVLGFFFFFAKKTAGAIHQSLNFFREDTCEPLIFSFFLLPRKRGMSERLVLGLLFLYFAKDKFTVFFLPANPVRSELSSCCRGRFRVDRVRRQKKQAWAKMGSSESWTSIEKHTHL